jgi:hypothetical protein
MDLLNRVETGLLIMFLNPLNEEGTLICSYVSQPTSPRHSANLCSFANSFSIIVFIFNMTCTDSLNCYCHTSCCTCVRLDMKMTSRFLSVFLLLYKLFYIYFAFQGVNLAFALEFRKALSRLPDMERLLARVFASR